MRVVADLDKCQGHGLCRMSAPDVYGVDGRRGPGHRQVRGGDPRRARGGGHRWASSPARRSRCASWRSEPRAERGLLRARRCSARRSRCRRSSACSRSTSPLTSDFGDRQLGLMVSAFWLVTAVAAPLCGRWVDRRGWPVGRDLGAARGRRLPARLRAAGRLVGRPGGRARRRRPGATPCARPRATSSSSPWCRPGDRPPCSGSSRPPSRRGRRRRDPEAGGRGGAWLSHGGRDRGSPWCWSARPAMMSRFVTEE